MTQDQPSARNPDTADKLREIDKRRNRAALKGIGVGLFAFVVAFAIYAWLKSLPSRSTTLDVILLLWNAVIIGAPFVGVWVYKKNK